MEKPQNHCGSRVFRGASDLTRTGDLLITSEMHYRLCYMLEASMRLKGGHTIPLWEDLNFARLKKEMKKIKEKI